MTRFTQFDRVVSTMMKQFGGTGTLKIFNNNTYVDGEVISGYSSIPVNIVVLEYPKMNDAGDKTKTSTSILEGDMQCYVQPRSKADPYYKNFNISPARDTIVIGNTEWKIINVKDHNPSAQDSLYLELHIRK